MKRCPHCGVQDHDEAILCKSCMKSFAAPPERKAATPALPRAQRKGSPIGTLITLAIFGAIFYSMLPREVVGALMERLAQIRAGQSEDAPAVPETSPETPPPAAPEPPPAAASAEPTALPEPSAAPVAVAPPPPSLPATSAPAPAPRRTETRPPARPTPQEQATPRPAESAPPADAPPPPPAPPAGAVRVGGNIQAPAKVRDVRPMYPADAQSARIQGLVIIEATIGTDGRVRDTRVLRSVPMLDDAALAAVRQWEYEPTLLNGKPVAVIMTVTVNFRLQ